MSIRGSVALVTGASSGIGRATAEALATAGAHVLVHGRDKNALDELAERIGGTVLVADLSWPGEAERLADAALAVAGRVDILVANAGIGHAGTFVEMPPNEVDPLVAVNLTAPMRLVRALMPGMIERRRGYVCFVSSIAARTGVAKEAVYAATKAGLDAFADSLRMELNGTRVRVGVLIPGAVATNFFDRRGKAYGRTRPRPLRPEVLASTLVHMIDNGTAEAYLPRWLRVPVALRSLAPRTYRRLALRFGGS